MVPVKLRIKINYAYAGAAPTNRPRVTPGANACSWFGRHLTLIRIAAVPAAMVDRPRYLKRQDLHVMCESFPPCLPNGIQSIGSAVSCPSSPNDQCNKLP